MDESSVQQWNRMVFPGLFQEMKYKDIQQKQLSMDPNNSEIVSYNVATLNYSATIVSPYQFHEHSTQDLSLFQFKLNEAFRSFASKQIPNFDEPNFEWGMTSLDFSWKKRFSPFYLQHCGVGPNGKMMNEQEFLNQWNKDCEKVKSKLIEEAVQRQVIKGTKLSKQEIISNIERQIADCRQYDLIGYRAFIKTIYGLEDIKNIDQSSEKYVAERKKHFSKSYITELEKRKRTIQMIQDRAYDIFCMQECSREFIEYLKSHIKSYLVIQMPNKLSTICDSIILLKKSKFPGYTAQKVEEQRNAFLTHFAELSKNPNPAKFSKKLSAEVVNYLNEKSEQFKNIDIEESIIKIHKQLFWNDDTCYAVIGPLIIFSPHISTKVNLNYEQINFIKKTLVKIVTYFPDKFFICAGDLNGEFESQINFETVDKRFIKVNAFPYHNDDITCYKMRTLTQAQKSKALEISFCKKDYIITDLKQFDQLVVMADGTPVTKANAPLLPNDKHPFDHFIVSAEVRLTDRVQSTSSLVKKKPVSSPFEGFSLDFAPDRNI